MLSTKKNQFVNAFGSLTCIQKMDRNHDGVVTIDEFLDCCRYDQAIKNSMLVFDSSIWPCEYGVNGNSHVINSHSPSHSIPNAKNLTDNANNKNAHPHAKTTSGNFVGNKIRNNVGHKASQMRRIQLSSASKRCKSMDNNTPKAINSHTDPLKAATTTGDDNIVESRQTNAVDDSTSANSSTSQAIGPRKLVKVKTWYTQSTSVQLPATTSTLNERQLNLPWYYFVTDVDLWPMIRFVMIIGRFS